MAERVTVRRATEDDVEAIQRVADRTWHETYEGILSANIGERGGGTRKSGRGTRPTRGS